MTVPAKRRAPPLFTIAVVAVTGALLALVMLRSLPARIVNGEHGRVAMQTLDEVRRPFLNIQGASSVLMNEGYSESVGAYFQRGVARGRTRIADFKAAAAYNPDLLHRVELLADAFEAWVQDERSLFSLAESNRLAGYDVLHALAATSSRGFSLSMALMEDSEGLIHGDVVQGSNAVVELSVIGGFLIASLTGTAFFLMWSRNRALGTMLSLRKRAAREILRLNEDLERRVDERTEELRNAQAELVRAERLATLGQLTGTVAHELRNPLGAVMSSLGVIRLKCQSANLELEETLDRANRGIRRCDGIITELLDFARAKGLRLEPTALDAWLKELLDEQELPEGIKVTHDGGLDGNFVSIDREEVRRAVINVIENACQAMTDANGDNSTAGRGELTVATRRNGERIEIEIDDTGPGIPEDILPRIYEPLFSTKTFGVGLGLSIVRQITEHHGGGLEISSRQGEGTQAILWLPRSPCQEEGAQK